MNAVHRSEEFPHVLAEAHLPDGRTAHINPLTFGRARLVLVSKTNALTYDDLW